jgi:hypothetical protein
MSGGSDSSTSVQTSLPAALQPLAAAYNTRALGLSDQAFTPYTGQRFNPSTADQQSAYDLVRQRALSGSPIMGQANDTLTGIMRGGQTNPYLDQLVNRAQQNIGEQYSNIIRPQQNARMAASGSFGNSGVDASIGQDQNMLLRNMGDVASQMYGGAYNTDRANQMAALQMAPGFANQAYGDASQLLNVGNQQQQLGQQQSDFAYQQWQDAQAQPYKNLQTLGAPFSLNQGGTTVTQANGGK